MGILNRVTKLVKANLGELWERTRDPVDALDRFLREMDEEIASIKAEIAESTREERRLQQRSEEEEAAVEHWHRQALRALNRGEEDLAREALRRKRRAQRALSLLQDQQTHQQRVSGVLRSHIEELQLKLEEARLHKDHLAVNQRIHDRRKEWSQRASRWPELEETFRQTPAASSSRPERARPAEDPYVVEAPAADRQRAVELPPGREGAIEDEFDRRFRDLELADLRESREQRRGTDDLFVEEELRRLKKEQKKKGEEGKREEQDPSS